MPIPYLLKSWMIGAVQCLTFQQEQEGTAALYIVDRRLDVHLHVCQPSHLHGLGFPLQQFWQGIRR